MNLRVYYDSRCLAHENGPGHPERPERLIAVRTRIEQSDYGRPVQVVSPDPAGPQELARVHTASYLEELERSSRRAHTVFDPDTSANEHSYHAARLAAGGALAAVRSVIAGEAVYPFVAMRPPGHHAEADRAMGFCLLNSVAVAAADAIAAGLERVAIVDWDVHHGNGTEHIFRARRDVLYVSLHQAPHYPGTGRSTDVGEGAGAGFTVNIPLPSGSGDAEYRYAFGEVVIPVLEQYQPQLLIVSAGFDVDERDPLAGMLLTSRSVSWITARLLDTARLTAQGRIVHVLEGGYDVVGLAEGVDAVLSILAGRPAEAPDDADEAGPFPRAAAAVEETRRAQAPYWSPGVQTVEE